MGEPFNPFRLIPKAYMEAHPELDLQVWLEGPSRYIESKDIALDAGIAALVRLSKKGSITRELREETIRIMWEARQTPLMGDEEYRPLYPPDEEA